MPEEREIPRIEPVPMLQHKVADPNPAGQRALLPVAVQNAVNTYHDRMREAELNRLQKLYTENRLSDDEIMLLVQNGIIEQPKNIFQLLQEKSLEALISMVLDFLKNNLRTTIAGAVFILTQLCVKLGFSAPTLLNDTLYAISYVFMFGMADGKISARWVVGSVLTVLSLFIGPIAGLLGFASNPLVMTTVQLLVQQAVAFLLKDQTDLQKVARSTGALPATVFLLMFLFTSNTASAQVPSQFTVFNSTIQVKYDSTECDSKNAWGIYQDRKNTILLNNTSKQQDNSIEGTFYHEFVHCLFEKTGRNDLSRNERFVALLARAMHQARATMRFDSIQYNTTTAIRYRDSLPPERNARVHTRR